MGIRGPRPADKAAFRSGVSTLPDWLSVLAPCLAADSGAIVNVSVGRWSDFITAISGKTSLGRLRKFKGWSELDVAGELTNSLLPQREMRGSICRSALRLSDVVVSGHNPDPAGHLPGELIRISEPCRS